MVAGRPFCWVRSPSRASDSKDREGPLNTLKDWMKDGSAAHNHPTIHLIASIMLYHEGNYEEAMRAVYQSQTLEG